MYHCTGTMVHLLDIHLISPAPQSNGPSQTAVHKTPLQSGASALFTAPVGWQHGAGTQSTSTEHCSAAGVQEIKSIHIDNNKPIITFCFINISSYFLMKSSSNCRRSLISPRRFWPTNPLVSSREWFPKSHDNFTNAVLASRSFPESTPNSSRSRPLSYIFM